MKKVHLTLCLTLISLIGYSQWIPLTSGTSQHLYSVCFTTASIGFAVGNNGTILKTSDAGSNWTVIPMNTMQLFWAIDFPSISTGYVLGSSNLFKTTDYGNSWTGIIINLPGGYRSIYFLNENVGFMAGHSGSLIKSVNGGTTWTSIPTGTNLTLMDVYFIDEERGFVLSTNLDTEYPNGNIHRTLDGGITWYVIYNNNHKLNSICFVNENTGYIVGGGWSDAGGWIIRWGVIMKTINGGETWTQETIGWSILRSVFFMDENSGCAVGDDGTILKTIDGSNWTPCDTITDHHLKSVFFTDYNTGYAVGEGGTILKTTNGGLTFEKEFYTIGNDFDIFPNPANNKITVSENSGITLSATLDIFHIDGKHALQQDFQNQKLIEMDITTLPKGIYLLKIQTKEGMEVKKLVKQ
jgi:photosystem II stability/assembly factor-like uncharacterized protein